MYVSTNLLNEPNSTIIQPNQFRGPQGTDVPLIPCDPYLGQRINNQNKGAVNSEHGKGERWGDCSSVDDDCSSEDLDKAEDLALVLADDNQSMPLIVDRATSKFGEAEDSRIIEEKLVQIANILGISIYDRLGDLRSFIHNMLKKERDQHAEINKKQEKNQSSKGVR